MKQILMVIKGGLNMEIKEEQELVLENILSLRKKMTQQQMQEEMIKISQVMQEVGVQKGGPLTTATYAVIQSGNEQLMDIEIIVPLNKKVDLPTGYTFKPMIKIIHALCIRHIGSPTMLSNTITTLNNYIIKNNKQVITPTYNVTVKDAMNQDELDDMIMDIYVGYNPCIL